MSQAREPSRNSQTNREDRRERLVEGERDGFAALLDDDRHRFHTIAFPMKEHRYRPDAAFARKFVSEAAIATDIPVSTFVETKPLVESPTPAIEYGLDATNPKHLEALQKLERGYEAVTSEPGFKSYLDVLSKLYTYSPRNVMLIFSQRPDATMVNSYDRWKESGRQVKKGSRGIQIFYPQHRFVDDVDPDTGDSVKRKMLVGFGIGSVFDVSDTDGPPIEPPTKTPATFGVSPEATQLDRKAASWGIGEGIIMEKRPSLMGERGRYSPIERRIVLSEELQDNDGKVKTLVHELAHYAAGDTAGWQGRSLSELIAEGTAYTVLQAAGIDTADYSFQYLKHFTDEPGAFKLAIPEIAKHSRKLITEFSSEDLSKMEEWA